MKADWMTKDEAKSIAWAKLSDEQLKADWGFSEYTIAQIRKSAKHIQEISAKKINGMRVPTQLAMYVMHAQARKSRDYHYILDVASGQILQRIYVSNGAWVENRPENSYEIALGMSDIPVRPTYRDLLESIVEQMRSQGDA